MYEINTSKFIKVKKVLIDGKEWEIRPSGAGEELALSQAQRRLTFIENRIKKGVATSEELEQADALEVKMMTIFKGLFKDGTDDNSEVRAWIDSTPLSMIYAVLEEIKKQSEANDEATGNQARGQAESPGVPETPAIQG